MTTFADQLVARLRGFDDDVLDRMDSAYVRERDRWYVYRLDDEPKRGSRYQLIRNSSPNGDINAEEYFEITTFTKRECRNSDDADAWLSTFAGRAAMRAALGALR